MPSATCVGMAHDLELRLRSLVKVIMVVIMVVFMAVVMVVFMVTVRAFPRLSLNIRRIFGHATNETSPSPSAAHNTEPNPSLTHEMSPSPTHKTGPSPSPGHEMRVYSEYSWKENMGTNVCRQGTQVDTLAECKQAAQAMRMAFAASFTVAGQFPAGCIGSATDNSQLWWHYGTPDSGADPTMQFAHVCAVGPGLPLEVGPP